jgi:hypothetical protein
VLTAKIKDDHCYGFVTFDKRESAEAAIAAGQRQDGIDLITEQQAGSRILGTWITTRVEEGHWRIHSGSWERFINYWVEIDDLPSTHVDQGSFGGRPIVAYDDLL